MMKFKVKKRILFKNILKIYLFCIISSRPAYGAENCTSTRDLLSQGLKNQKVPQISYPQILHTGILADKIVCLNPEVKEQIRDKAGKTAKWLFPSSYNILFGIFGTISIISCYIINTHRKTK